MGQLPACPQALLEPVLAVTGRQGPKGSCHLVGGFRAQIYVVYGHLCVCACLCMHVWLYMSVNVYTCMRAHGCAHVYLYAYTCSAHTCIRIHVCIPRILNPSVCMCAKACMSVYMYTHETCTHLHVSMSIYTFVHVCKGSQSGWCMSPLLSKEWLFPVLALLMGVALMH